MFDHQIYFYNIKITMIAIIIFYVFSIILSNYNNCKNKTQKCNEYIARN